MGSAQRNQRTSSPKCWGGPGCSDLEAPRALGTEGVPQRLTGWENQKPGGRADDAGWWSGKTLALPGPFSFMAWLLTPWPLSLFISPRLKEGLSQA